MSKDLNPQKALIFRIVHRDNMGDVWADGCQCKNATHGKKYTQIGNLELISKRDGRVVPCAPGGTLSDYVPFYFTPYTPMLYNIKTGHGGMQKRPVEEIVILITSLHTLKSQGVPFVFSDRHAYLKTALFSNDLADLNWIIWPTLQARNFRKDDLDRFEKYQAEALIHKHMPLSALTGVVCYNDSVRADMQAAANAHKVTVKIIAQPNWYL
jgi:ssDNA thymidine ADP-ribosyltransferase DarT-like protein